MNISGHTVLITGGASGVGFALARAFRARDNKVVLLGRDPDRLHRAADALGGAATITCDVGDLSALQGIMPALARHAPSILINNAAVQLNYDFTTAPLERVLSDVEAEVRVNFTGLVQLTALTLPLLQCHPGGAVVNITSGLAFAPKKSAAVYSATKAAVRTFSKALRYQVQDAHLPLLVVDVVLPLVDTPMTSGRSGGRKVSTDFVSNAILRGLERDRSDVYVGLARPFAALHRLVPGVAERLLRDG
ncbi:SDR family NAD(P)-dependent oxidoreductase [Deinococcus navajonensis]|uniref:SDR family NAD(P)-dependent oxidoreductase n=1 Tax=Deinococcus navajonensis TaxID=309884 RepID=A0ABV8XIX3_9DEIO